MLKSLDIPHDFSIIESDSEFQKLKAETGSSTFPQIFVDGEYIRPSKLIAFILAFFGLSICLGPNWNSLDIRGILLVLLGSFCSAGMIVGASKATKIISMSDLIFFSNTIGAMILGIILFIYDHFTLSYSLAGWLGIILICILFNIGQLSLFAATKKIGSEQQAEIESA